MIMGMWKEYRLGDIAVKIGSGATPTGGGNTYKATGISLIRSQNVLDFKFSHDGLAFIDENQAYSLRNVEVYKNCLNLVAMPIRLGKRLRTTKTKFVPSRNYATRCYQN